MSIPFSRMLAAAGLLGLSLGSAQADPSVVLYGLADAGPMHRQYTFRQGGTDVRQSSNGLASGVMNSSRLGVKGSEDLGRGLSAIFNLEQKVDLGDGAGGNWKRQAWVGLSSKRWGTITLGRQKEVADKMFKIQTTRGLGKASRAFGGAGGRHDALIKYLSPQFGGVRGGVAYARGTRSDDYRHFWSLGAQYAKGPVLVGGGYDIDRLRAGYSVRNWALGGSYDFKVVQLALGYGQDSNGKLNAPGNVKASTLGGYKPAGLGDYNSRGFKSRNYYLGAVVPAGPGELGLTWSHSSSNLGRMAGVAAGSQDILVAQYKHPLSKRTFLYAYGAYARNLAYLSGFNGRELALGMQHRF